MLQLNPDTIRRLMAAAGFDATLRADRQTFADALGCSRESLENWLDGRNISRTYLRALHTYRPQGSSAQARAARQAVETFWEDVAAQARAAGIAPAARVTEAVTQPVTEAPSTPAPVTGVVTQPVTGSAPLAPPPPPAPATRARLGTFAALAAGLVVVAGGTVHALRGPTAAPADATPVHTSGSVAEDVASDPPEELPAGPMPTIFTGDAGMGKASARRVPAHPLKGQGRAPCPEGTLAVNGSCWSYAADKAHPGQALRAPCPTGTYEAPDGLCLLPTAVDGRPLPSSETDARP